MGLKRLAGAVRGPERWLLFAKGSIGLNLLLAAGKLLAGFWSLSLFLCVNALYNLCMALAKGAALEGHYRGRPCYGRVGAILSVASAVYIVYCLRLFLHGSAARYSDIEAITIAAVTFGEIGLAVHGSVTLRHGREPAMLCVKLVNLASAFISLVLTQTAILSFTTEGDHSAYNGLCGVLFGLCAGGIGLYMLLVLRLRDPVQDRVEQVEGGEAVGGEIPRHGDDKSGIGGNIVDDGQQE